jgi:hypothetical protein
MSIIAWAKKILNQPTTETELDLFFKKDNYFKNEFPNDLYPIKEYFTFECMDFDDEVFLHQVFKKESGSNSGKSANHFISYSEYDKIEDKLIKSNLSFLGETIPFVDRVSLSISHCYYQNKLFYSISIIVGQDSFKLNKAKSPRAENCQWSFMIKSSDIRSFYEFVYKNFFDYADVKMKIKNKIKNFNN